MKEFLEKVGSPIYQAKATGCAFNLRAAFGPDAGVLMKRAWQIVGNIDLIPQMLDRPCTCPEGTEHAVAEGRNTEHTGKYTQEFVRTVHCMFSQVAQTYRRKKI